LEICKYKNAEFFAESKYEERNAKQIFVFCFTKIRGKIEAFNTFTYTVQGFFLWCLTFLVELFCNFSQSFALGIKFCMLEYPF